MNEMKYRKMAARKTAILTASVVIRTRELLKYSQ